MSNAITTSRNSKWLAAGLTLSPGGLARACRLYATAWPAAATYTSATQTWEADANGAMGTIDDVAPAVGDRIVYAAGGSSDGVFTVVSLGGASAKFSLVRAGDFVQTTDYLNANASQVGIYAGTTNGGKVLTLTVASNFVLDTGTPTFTSSASTVSESTVRTALASSAGTVAINAQTLSNSGGIVFTKETAISVAPAISTTADTAGGAVTVAGAAGLGTGAGGALTARGGVGGLTGAGGAASLLGGAGGATSGTGGAVTVAGGAGTAGNANGGAVTINAGAKHGVGTDGALTIGSTAASLALGNSGAILTHASKQAAGAATNTIADPGTGAAIPVTSSGVCMITTAAAETNTLANPTFVGQSLSLVCSVYAVGDREVTAAARINQAANTIMTFGAVGDFIKLEGITIGGALRWQVVANDGVALS